MFNGFVKKIKILTGICLFLLVSMFLVALVLKNVGTWLLLSDSVPDRLDLVFTFAGENVRDTYSRELMQKFPKAHWLMSDYKGGYSRILRRENFDMSRVSVVDTCSNTLSEVITLKNWIDTGYKPSDGDSVLYVGLVSGPYHMRRIRMMVNKNLPKQNVRFFLLPVPMKKYNWTHDMFRNWWNSPVSKSVTSEMMKIAYFLLIS